MCQLHVQLLKHLKLFSAATLFPVSASCRERLVLPQNRPSPLCFMRSLYLSYSPTLGHGPVRFTLRPSCDCCCCSGIQPRWSSTAQMLTTPDKNLESKTWGVGGREKEITEDCTWREKIERTERERESAASKSCPVVVAMPRAKQAFYHFLGFGFILVLWVPAS